MATIFKSREGLHLTPFTPRPPDAEPHPPTSLNPNLGDTMSNACTTPAAVAECPATVPSNRSISAAAGPKRRPLPPPYLGKHMTRGLPAPPWIGFSPRVLPRASSGATLCFPDTAKQAFARGVLRRYHSRGYGTLVFWEGKFHNWDGIKYRLLPRYDLHPSINACVYTESMMVFWAKCQANEKSPKGKPPRWPYTTHQRVMSVLALLKVLTARTRFDGPGRVSSPDDYPRPSELILARLGHEVVSDDHLHISA